MKSSIKKALYACLILAGLSSNAVAAPYDVTVDASMMGEEYKDYQLRFTTNNSANKKVLFLNSDTKFKKVVYDEWNLFTAYTWEQKQRRAVFRNFAKPFEIDGEETYETILEIFYPRDKGVFVSCLVQGESPERLTCKSTDYSVIRPIVTLDPDSKEYTISLEF